MRDRFRQFMMGRYGNDHLNGLIFVIALVFVVLDIVLKKDIFQIIALICLVLIYFRMFSRNVEERYAENQKFLGLLDRIKSIFVRSGRSSYGKRTEDRQYKIYSCPRCRQKIRVPRGKGRIRIRCPRCGNSFIKKT